MLDFTDSGLTQPVQLTITNNATSSTIFRGVYSAPDDSISVPLAEAITSEAPANFIHRFPEALIVAPPQAIAADQRYFVAVAGEIYNGTQPLAEYLLQHLQKRPLSEVIRDFNGSFVGAIYQKQARQWQIFRDQLGQNFIFHTIHQGHLIFDSKLSTLAKLPGVSTAPDYQAVADFFALGYIPSPRTIYSKIHKTAAATIDSIDVTGGNLTSQRYWEPPFDSNLLVTPEDAAVDCRRLLTLAIQRRLSKHPDVAATLSGGIDSGVVTGLAKDYCSDTINHAHTIAFDVPQYDESGLAQGTAKRCCISLNIHQLLPEVINTLPALVTAAGEPYADSSLLAAAALANCAGAPALLTGDGGDEIFGGYRRYQAMLLRHRIPHWLDLLARPACGLLSHLLPPAKESRSRYATIRRSVKSLSQSRLDAYASFQQLAPSKLLQNLLTLPESTYRDQWRADCAAIHVSDAVRQYNALDLRYYLPEDCLRKTNIVSALYGTQYLTPLLDMDVVNFALALPTNLRFTPSANKVLLRQLGEKYLAPEILTTTKRGFGVPLSQWFRGPLAPRITAMADAVQEWDHLQVINSVTLKRLANEHLRGSHNHAAILWATMVFQEWEGQLTTR